MRNGASISVASFRSHIDVGSAWHCLQGDTLTMDMTLVIKGAENDVRADPECSKNIAGPAFDVLSLTALTLPFKNWW